MEFTLAHGTGNDFVVLPDLDDRLTLSATLARALADRRHGVGGDGVIRIAPGAGDADVFMDHRNADGSLAEMCGNGVRVVAKHVVDHGIVPVAEGGVVRVDSRSGIREVVVHLDDAGHLEVASVDMGVPVFDPAEVPFETDASEALQYGVDVDGQEVQLAVVSMGNPHAVVAVDDVDDAPVRTLGPKLEVHTRFPAKTNVGFAQVLGRDTVRLRVWERGVGETAACGTGACAAVAALQRLGQLDDEVAVRLPGGSLTVQHTAGGTATMTGPAVEVAHGTLDPAWLATAEHDPED